jgi:copper chaperone CopZ
MTHSYQVSGMTCNGCAATVKRTLSGVAHVQQVDIDLPANEAIITMDSHVNTAQLQQALQQVGSGKYAIWEKQPMHHTATNVESAAQTVNALLAYKPILLVFAYLLGVSLLIEAGTGSFNTMRWMNHFMGAFFLVFSFFKMLDLQGFADSYSTYDVVAKRWPAWGFVYAFIELLLGVAYLLSFQPVLTNAITLAIMAVSIIGVLQSVMNKQKIKCACLGTVFNLPMSTVTIVEDGLMMAMSAAMLISLS